MCRRSAVKTASRDPCSRSKTVALFSACGDATYPAASLCANATALSRLNSTAQRPNNWLINSALGMGTLPLRAGSIESTSLYRATSEHARATRSPVVSWNVKYRSSIASSMPATGCSVRALALCAGRGIGPSDVPIWCALLGDGRGHVAVAVATAAGVGCGANYANKQRQTPARVLQDIVV